MKPGYVWALFGLCVVLAVIAMAWSSVTVLRLERAEVAARTQAAVEENARLALWRMDSALTTLLAQESARPYFHYSAFYPAGGAYERMFAPSAPGAQALAASPLLGDAPPRLHLHFQITPSGTITSPQVPRGVQRATARSTGLARDERLQEYESRLVSLQNAVGDGRAFAQVPQPGAPARSLVILKKVPSDPAPSQRMKSTREFEARQQSYAQANLAPKDVASVLSPVAGPEGSVEQGTLTPLWIGDALVLARRVRVNGVAYVQGAWVDWDALERELLASVEDLLPRASLARVVSAASGSEEERRLAALPIQLVPGAVAAPPEAALAPARLSLIGAWVGLVLAATSVAVLLHGVMALSERRRVFVSAVTHELRTPLTTFRLYTDMLAEGMVSGEEKRREYLSRLRHEALRLGHLVENVLFYARIESGRAGAVRESVDLGEALAEVLGRLRERVERAGLALDFDATGSARLRVRVDRSALEQILVNLVDNACKYAAKTDPPAIEVRLARDGGRAIVRVRDHGPGLSPAEQRRLFHPFSKSDRDAADSAPGVGLGLALSRRLARAQDGDLRFEAAVPRGAAFTLSLPLERTSTG